MRHLRSLCSVALLVFLAFPHVSARTPSLTGVIEGRVVDSSGGILPGVTVTLIPAAGGLARAVTADNKGVYRFVGLQPGTYEVRASLSGFTTAVQAVTLGAGETRRVELVLSVATLAEEVRVTAAAPLVDSRLTTAAVAVNHPSPFRQHAAWNTTSFDKIDEHRFTWVADAPLSTFSIDVDTASYAYMRRSLVEGDLPPRDAIRAEELVNYFRYDYPPPGGDAPFSVSTEVGRCPWEPKHLLLHIGLQAGHPERRGAVRRNLVFLLDVSGSMDSLDKLPLVKAAMSLLANRLTEQDTVAIVVYAGSSGLALPTTRGDRHEEILRAIAGLHAGGSTNGAEGIESAYRLARDAFIDGGVNRVILATDGDFNVGLTSRGALVDLIEEKRKSGIYLSVLGVGDDNLKDGQMEQLANRGNGNYAYLDTLEEAQKVLVREAEATLIPVAADVKIQVEFNPRQVAGYRLIGYENRDLRAEDFKDDRKDAGELGAGQSVTALYEIVPAAKLADVPRVDPLRYQQERQESSAARRAEMALVKLRYKRPGTTRSLPMDTVVSMPGPLGDRCGDNLGFSAAVAAFAMLLRDSTDKGNATWRMAADLAREHRGPDPDGYRAQFVRLVEMAEGLAAARAGADRQGRLERR